MKSVIFLPIDVIININRHQTRLFGGMHKIRDLNLLESAVARPQTIINGIFAYPNTNTMAAVYAHGIIKNHPFIDGNKRTGMATATIFLDLNGYEVTLSNNDIVDLGVALAVSEISYEQIAEIFRVSTYLKS